MFVDGEGPIPSETLILGEAPGATEERLGRPFVGSSGELLDSALEAAGVRRTDVYITNAYKLRPPNNRTPTPAELAEHKGVLLEEFEQVNPKRVLLLGQVALRTVYPALSVGRVRGAWQPLSRAGRWYMSTWHPAYTIYNRKARPEFFEDVRRFFDSNP